jgi:hypothetical protein
MTKIHPNFRSHYFSPLLVRNNHDQKRKYFTSHEINDETMRYNQTLPFEFSHSSHIQEFTLGLPHVEQQRW